MCRHSLSSCAQVVMALNVLSIPSLPCEAAQFGPFVYEVSGGEVEITRFRPPFNSSENYTDVLVPAEIDGLPVVRIGYRAFQQTNVENITFQEGVISIGGQAFSSCRQLRSISLPPGLVEIGTSAFNQCESLLSITVPATVTTFETRFWDCDSLAEIHVEAGSAAFSSFDGVLYDATGEHLRRCPPARSGLLSVPSGVTTIGQEAFWQCREITAVLLPPTVTSIGASAFISCSNLTEVNLPPNLTSIGSWAFAYSGLDRALLPATCTQLGDGPFHNCRNLQAIEVEVGNPAFKAIDGVLFTFDGETLVQCTAGRTGDYEIPTTVQCIAPWAFAGAGLSHVTIPDSVTSIGGGAFESCQLTEGLRLPPALTNLGWGAFAFCRGLRNLSIPPGITAIPGDAFRSCWGLTTLRIPPWVTEIGDRAFTYCRYLTDIQLPDVNTRLGPFCFQYCVRLQGVLIPAGIRTIDSGAFSECDALRSAVFLGDVPSFEDSSSPFLNSHEDFRVYFLEGTTGFSAPLWRGHPAVAIDAAAYPKGPWLARHGLAPDISLAQDLNGDGVNLLMAYALNLNPNLHLQRELPRPELHPDGMSITYYAGAAGIEYCPEQSGDMENWQTADVMISDLSVDMVRRAFVEHTSPHQFLRLRVKAIKP